MLKSLDSVMTEMLTLSDHEYKPYLVNMLRAVMKKKKYTTFKNNEQ